jgi:hypothetical protein
LALNGSAGTISVQLAFGTAELAAGAGWPAAAAVALCIFALRRSVSPWVVWAEADAEQKHMTPIDKAKQEAAPSSRMIEFLLVEAQTVRHPKSDYDVGKR